MTKVNTKILGGASAFVTIIVVVIIIAVLLGFSSQFFYFFEQVSEQEIGVQIEGSRVKDIVGPGVYSDFGVFVEMERVSSQAIPFSVSDPEIITRDKQRIGLVVSGDIVRPNLAQKDILRQYWAQYRDIFLNDDLARTRVEGQAKQAMKVCVGDRPFDDNIIGTARDELRACIDNELSELARNYGLEIQNVVVPEVILSPEVQAALDAIVQSRLETEKAAQDKLRAEAQAEAEQARQEGEIRIEQSRIQEQTKQQTILAELDQEKILAQKAVIEAERANELARVEAENAIIEAQKANELLAAERDLEINRAKALAAAEQAKADLAVQIAQAQIYAENPGYLQLQIVTANANALHETDKIIFTPEGTVPTLVLPGPGIVPTVDTAAAAATRNTNVQVQPASDEEPAEDEPETGQLGR
jgi:regulator of protease activity HflC (stomatin/prohibitin superfamily)